MNFVLAAGSILDLPRDHSWGKMAIRVLLLPGVNTVTSSDVDCPKYRGQMLPGETQAMGNLYKFSPGDLQAFKVVRAASQYQLKRTEDLITGSTNPSFCYDLIL